MLPMEVDLLARAIAAGGLAVAVAGLVWQIVQFRLNRARLAVWSYFGPASMVDGAPEDPALIVEVRNVGGAPTELLELVVEAKGESWYDEHFGPSLPLILTPGTRRQFAFLGPATGLASEEGPRGPVRAHAYFVGGSATGKWVHIAQYCVE